ncbi:hypothetical protein [Natrinema ejinorense]|uniref:hypothetical protein n=1 Tax=Natrinema ejinorense TaxID=373386 RepID=UPI00117D698B|nr:hypothetical protein [Natrinema ejinorense]
MSPQYSKATDKRASSSRSKTTRAVSILEKRGRDASLAMVAGGVSLALAFAAARERKGRSTLLALTRAGLLGLAVRQRRAEGATDTVETGADVRRDDAGEKRASDEAFAEAEQNLGAQRTADESAGVTQSETTPNPRGMTDRADVDADDSGDPQFVEGEPDGIAPKDAPQERDRSRPTTAPRPRRRADDGQPLRGGDGR